MTDQLSSKAPVRILICEDEQYIRDIYRDILTAEGFQVDEAPDGKVALEMMRAGGYDLVLLDIMMPYIDGLGVLKELQATPPKKTIRGILICTSLAADPSVKEALDTGAIDVVFKPDVTPDQLVQKIKKTLDKLDGKEPKGTIIH